MKKIFSVIAKGLFIVFIVAVFLWTASLTLAEVRAILPNDPITPYFALALFDGGAIAWLGAWLYHARGIFQRAISLSLMVIDLLGVILLSAGRLLGGGQTLTEAPENLGVTVVYGVVIATLINLAAIYAFHTTDPDTIEEIETSILEDTLRDEALSQAKASIESEAQQLGAILAARATGRLKYRLRLPMGQHEVNAIEHEDFEQPQPLIIPQPKPKTRKVNPLALWFAKTASNIQQRIGGIAQSPQMVTYESAAGNVLDGIETASQKPAETPISEQAEVNPTPQA